MPQPESEGPDSGGMGRKSFSTLAEITEESGPNRETSASQSPVKRLQQETSTSHHHDRKGVSGFMLVAIGLGTWLGWRYSGKRKRKANRRFKKDVPYTILSILNVLGIVLIVGFALIAPPFIGSLIIGLPSVVFGKLFLSYLFTILFSFLLVVLANFILFLSLPREKDNTLIYILFTVLLFIPIAFLVGPFSLAFFLQWLLSIKIGFGLGLLLSLSAAAIYLLSIGIITTTGLA